MAAAKFGVKCCFRPSDEILFTLLLSTWALMDNHCDFSCFVKSLVGLVGLRTVFEFFYTLWKSLKFKIYVLLANRSSMTYAAESSRSRRPTLIIFVETNLPFPASMRERAERLKLGFHWIACEILRNLHKKSAKERKSSERTATESDNVDVGKDWCLFR